MGRSDDIDILLVEDNPDDVEFTLRALRKANVALSIVLAEDGVKALEILHHTGARAAHRGAAAPRLVLLDLNLPRLNGVDVLRRMRSDPRTRTIPVVVLTSSREERDLRDAYAAGANSYVVKPDMYPALVALLGDIVRYWLQLNVAPAAMV